MKVRTGSWRVAAFGVLLLQAAAARADGEYDILIAGNVRGEMTIRTDSQGRHAAWRYIDRGRGPDIRATARLDAGYVPVAIDIEGTNYLKLPVSEQFTREGTTGKVRTGGQERVIARHGFYLPDEPSFDLDEVLVRALKTSAEKRVALLPIGEARLTSGGSLEIGDGQNRITAHLDLIEGVGFAPTPVWTDADGALIYEGSVWAGAVRKGLGDQVGALIAHQDKVIAARAEAMASALACQPAGALVVRDVGLYSPELGRRVPGQTVIVRGDRIEAVGPSLGIPSDAEVIDGKGMTLLPGLFDMHVHLSSHVDGLLALGSGVTSVRDVANDMENLAKLRAGFDAGRLVGPRVFASGMIDGSGPLAGPTKMLVDTPEQVSAAIDALKANGYWGVKIYSSIKPALVPAVVAAAHARGLKVGGHVPAGMTMEQALAAGYDEINHANFWLLNFMGADITAQTNGMTRIVATAENGADFDVESAEADRLVALLKRTGAWLDPTLSVFEDMLTARVGHPVPSIAAYANRLPPAIARNAMKGGIVTDERKRPRYAASLAKLRTFLAKLHREGVPMVAGTDGTPGLTLPRELENYVEAGLSPADALAMATLAPARLLGVEQRLGSIAPGKQADLVLVHGDPTRNISAVRNISMVVKQGRVHLPGPLLAAAGMTAPASRSERNTRSTRLTLSPHRRGTGGKP